MLQSPLLDIFEFTSPAGEAFLLKCVTWLRLFFFAVFMWCEMFADASSLVSVWTQIKLRLLNNLQHVTLACKRREGGRGEKHTRFVVFVQKICMYANMQSVPLAMGAPHFKMHVTIVTFSLLIREEGAIFIPLHAFWLTAISFFSSLLFILRVHRDLDSAIKTCEGKKCGESPNCCYIGPSTGAARLFLAGNYIGYDCRHCEGGKSPALFCRCLHPPTHNHWHFTGANETGRNRIEYSQTGEKGEGAAREEDYWLMFVCVCVMGDVRWASWWGGLIINRRKRDPYESWWSAGSP